MISINPFYTQLSQLCSINFSWIINISIVQLCLYNVSQLNIENASALSYFYCANFNLFLVFVIFFVGHFPIFVFYFIFLRLRIKLRLPTVSNLHIWAENCRQRKLHTYIQPCTYTLTHTYTNTLTSNQPHTHTAKIASNSIKCWLSDWRQLWVVGQGTAKDLCWALRGYGAGQ